MGRLLAEAGTPHTLWLAAAPHLSCWVICVQWPVERLAGDVLGAADPRATAPLFEALAHWRRVSADAAPHSW